jgi:hypothetical protein
MNDKNALSIIKEMTSKIKSATNNKVAITEKRYQYSKDECKTIFNNVYKAVQDYTDKDKSEDGYEKLLNSLSDRFKVSTTGGSVSRQVDSLSSADNLHYNQTNFQELLDNAKDVIIFIEYKTDKLPGTKISNIGNKEQELEEPNTDEVDTNNEQGPSKDEEEKEYTPPAK